MNERLLRDRPVDDGAPCALRDEKRAKTKLSVSLFAPSLFAAVCMSAHRAQAPRTADAGSTLSYPLMERCCRTCRKLLSL